MGTPNSTDKADGPLKAFVLDGTVPSLDLLCSLGLDIALLDRRIQVIKPQLKYLEGYCMLEEACDLTRDGKPWSTLVSETGRAGTRCFRMTQDATTTYPFGGWELLSLSPIGSGSYRDVEVFLLYDGTWLVWSDDHGFKWCDDASELMEQLTAIAGDSHSYGTVCAHCRHLRYWSPRHRHETVAIMLVLAAHVELLLERTVRLKSARLETQKALLDEIRSTNRRNGLLIEQTSNDA